MLKQLIKCRNQTNTVVKLHCKLKTRHPYLLKSALELIRNSASDICWVDIVNEKATFVDLPKSELTVRLKTTLSWGNEKDVIKYTDITDIQHVTNLYKRKDKILVIKLEKTFYLIIDKNNYKLVTSLLNRDENLEFVDRNFDLTCTEHLRRPEFDIFKIEKQSEPCHQDNSEENEKVLAPRSTKRRPTAVRPECKVQTHKNLPSVVYNVYPFESSHFNNPSHDNQDYKNSIQETDGACSFSHDSFVSNVGWRNSPSTTKPVSQSSKRESATARHVPLARYSEMKASDRRLRTFMDSDWDTHPNRPDVTRLVAWGFFYTGRIDLVRCYQCGIGFKDWSQEDVVEEEHIRHSPECAFLKEKLGQEILNQLKLKLLYQRDGHTSFASAAHSKNQAPLAFSGSIFTRNDSAGFLQRDATSNSSSKTSDRTANRKNANKNDEPKLSYQLRHPQYQTMDSRLETFKTFPRTVQQDQRKLAIGGFFYTGNEDTCRCFCCDGGMRNWEPEDDPIIEHAKYFPTCNYIRQIKGDDYIRRVRVEAGMETEQESLPQQNGYGIHSSVAVSQVSESAQNNHHASSLSNHQQKPNRSTIVKNVLQSGFEKYKVEKAVDILIKQGTLDFIEDDIVNIILDIPEADEVKDTSTVPNDSSPETMLQENQRLKSVLNCIICIKEEANVLFLPCAHHKVCQKCSEKMYTCPVCSREVIQKVKTYMS